ncbi:tRNA adenosine(34) deaminase TadA [Ottowia thiooxydans]|uniref:tRNA-specific adenosine deaminase n=1 Tax=Ottowia thiooxydans TaxID=219182 RepID=A0ABV2Q3G0_9BURK
MNEPQVLLDDAHWMQQALAAARAAGEQGEVPVGAVVVRHGQLIATGSNSPISGHDPTAHAEIAALRAAALKLGNYRLDDCELYVTLEPCSMCAGAMLHARFKRVVFGAPDPRTGAAGSVVNLFDQPKLNHQTQVSGGVLERECGELLREFFRPKRGNRNPLREDALRTPEAAFSNLPGYPRQTQYISDLPNLAGLRLSYVDEGDQAASRTWLCLHGNPTWSYLYRQMIAVLSAAGDRVIAPDMPGFGKSDKPKREAAHSFSWHRQILLELVERLDLTNVVLIGHDVGALLGLTLPMTDPHRYAGLLAMNAALPKADVLQSGGSLEWHRMLIKPGVDLGSLVALSHPQLSADEQRAYQAPFPDAGFRAAIRALSLTTSDSGEDERAALLQRALQFLRNEWAGRSLMVLGAQDPLVSLHDMEMLQAQIRNCPAPWVLEQAGHFAPEAGQLIAEHALAYFSVS